MGKTVKTKEYDVSEIKKGYFICWNICTQAGYMSTVALKDEKKEYFTIKKPTNNHHLQLLGQGSADVIGDKLRLIITTECDGEINQSINSYNVTDNKAATVGHGYNLCIEDSTDEDFNDIYVDLIGWKRKG